MNGIQDISISFFQQMGKNTSLLFQLLRNGCLKALLALCFDESVSADVALGLFINEIKNASSSQQKPIMPKKHFSRYIMGGLLYDKTLLRKLMDGSEFSNIGLGRAKLLRSLLGSGIAASLDDVANGESSARLCEGWVWKSGIAIAGINTDQKFKVYEV
ncbi:hypothetical protein KIW84_052046 [Lathyrus oleraceus]|uniref:Uncharacterized protein n=1 Tax=Pisum sativum TaxID=3888 RepID=A0A9D4WMN1_PEA|nr:hypothetical protein KIW84_052046 [Pisum sativum]